MTTEEPQQSKEPYRLTEQVEIDLASLAMQERATIDLMGGLFPERENDFRGLARVVDIACGTGYWAVSVARENPQMEVIGLAHQTRLAEYAEGLAAAQGVENARFLLMTGSQKPLLPFPDDYLNLVHAQYLYAWLRTEEWAGFLRECWRVVSPGGYLHMMEPDWQTTGSPALTQIRRLFLLALKKAGHLPSENAEAVVEASHLGGLCEKAGWQHVTLQNHLTDYGTGSDLPQNAALRVEILARSFRPIILDQGIASADELAEWTRLLREEMEHGTFRVKRIWTVVCARKPQG